MEEGSKLGLERVTDMMGDCNTVTPSAYCDTSGGEKVDCEINP